MKNVTFAEFGAEMLMSYSRWGENLRISNVRQKIIDSLKDHKAIMDINWTSIHSILQTPSYCAQVYVHGWDFNEDTRNLHSIFQSLVADGPKKPLEDYL